MGTRFLATRESLWTEPRKSLLVAGQGDLTQQSRLYDTLNSPDWPREFPARYLRNATSDRWEGKEATLEANAEAEQEIYAALPQDDLAQRLVLAGESVDQVKDVPSARDVVERTVADAIAVMHAGTAMLRG